MNKNHLTITCCFFILSLVTSSATAQGPFFINCDDAFKKPSFLVLAKYFKQNDKNLPPDKCFRLNDRQYLVTVTKAVQIDAGLYVFDATKKTFERHNGDDEVVREFVGKNHKRYVLLRWSYLSHGDYEYGYDILQLTPKLQEGLPIVVYNLLWVTEDPGAGLCVENVRPDDQVHGMASHITGYQIVNEGTEHVQIVVNLKQQDCKTSQIKTVNKKFILYHNRFVEDSPNAKLTDAVRRGALFDVKSLLTEGADANVRSDNDETVLMEAARNGSSDVAALLIEKGADVNAKGRLSDTPLMQAARNGHGDAVALLIKKGADVNAKGNLGLTPLTEAVFGGNRDVVALLIEKGADVNAKCTDGETALMEADNRDTAELLLAKGIDVNARTKYGFTALIYATLKSRRGVVELLLAKGADVNAKTWSGETALMEAAALGHRDVVALLIKKGADVNLNNGSTALINASESGHKDVVELLLARGADINATTKAGETALALASKNNHKDVENLLRQHGGHL